MRLTNCLFARDYYQVLGLDKNCTAKDIRTKYVELCKLFHPDTVTSGDAKELDEKKKRFQEVQQAYNTLSKTNDRKVYDHQQSTYSDFGESGTWQRQYRPPPPRGESDPYERAREFHRRRRRQQNTETDGWTWGDYWKDDGTGHQEKRKDWTEEQRDAWFYENERRKWEREKDEYARYARNYARNNTSFPPFDRFTGVMFCISLIIAGVFLNLGQVAFLDSEKRWEEERAKIIALMDKQRQNARKYDLNKPEDRQKLEMAAHEYARRYR